MSVRDESRARAASARERPAWLDAVLLTLAAAVEHGVWRVSLIAAAGSDPPISPLPWPGLVATVVGALAARLGTRPAALVTLGLVALGSLVRIDGRYDPSGVTLIDTAHHAFVPCMLALFAERLEAEGPSPGRLARMASFVLWLQVAVGVAPILLEWIAPIPTNPDEARQLGPIPILGPFLLVGAATVMGKVPRARLVVAALPPPSAYRGPLPMGPPRRLPTVADRLRVLATLVMPAAVFTLMAAARPPAEPNAGPDLVALALAPLASMTGAIGIGLLARRRSTLSPLVIFGGALALAGLAWTVTSLPTTSLHGAGFMAAVSAAAPIATAYAAVTVRGNQRSWVIGAWSVMIMIASHAGETLPRRANASAFITILAAALAIVCGAWLVRRAPEVQARFDGATGVP
ncbi:MAG: hypothetical protein U0270_45530 [Labilithrix sp.]